MSIFGGKRVINRLIACLLFVVCAFSLFGCTIKVKRPKTDDSGDATMQPTTEPVIFNNSGVSTIYKATDDLMREISYPKDESEATNNGKEVGIFYFLWHEISSEGPYDVSKILANDANAARSNEAWLAAGGGETGKIHWWGEPLFGYYKDTDPWVIERDVQMLTDAGVDFVCIDCSNSSTFPNQVLTLLKSLDKYAKQGFKVPKVTFITKNSIDRVRIIYEESYKPYPEYEYLWYKYDGKPLMIARANTSELSTEIQNYFTFLYAQWPRESYHENGFPWMDFSFPQTVYCTNHSKSVVSVSVAQHSGTLAFSSSAFYGNTTNHTRSWHNGANETSDDAVLHGYNFAEQFEKAIELDPDIIFVTGWNEWFAGRQAKWHDVNDVEYVDPVILVDCCNINNSRDIQPMNGGYGDNYYMQLVNYIRKFKGYTATNTALDKMGTNSISTIDVSGSFDQWNQVEPFYLDYTEDTIARNYRGWGKTTYRNSTGRNDFYKMKVTSDENSIYFYAETVDSIKGTDLEHCMTLFIGTGKTDEDWQGYDFVVGRKMATDGGLTLEKRSKGAWSQIATVSYKLEGNKLMIEIPRELLTTLGSGQIEFKWVDNYQNEDDIWSFYTDGDAAPYGRLNYVYNY